MSVTKTIIAAALLCIIGLHAQAQDKKVEWGVAAGYSYNMPRLKDGRTVKTPAINGSQLNGFHVGPIVKFNFDEQFGLQTGLLFNHFNGVSVSRSDLALKRINAPYQQTRTQLMAFDMPIRFMYSMMLAEEMTVFLFVGPNLNYGLNKITATEYFVENKLQRTEKEENIYETTQYRRFDLQMGAGAGVKYYGLSVRAGYDWGILNRTTINEATLRANDIKISLAYTF